MSGGGEKQDKNNQIISWGKKWKQQSPASFFSQAHGPDKALVKRVCQP